jgi:putative ATPase
MDLFDHHRETQIDAEAPLAARLRPRTLDEFIGQDAVVGPGRLLRRAIQADQLSSLIFLGHRGQGRRPWRESLRIRRVPNLLR